MIYKVLLSCHGINLLAQALSDHSGQKDWREISQSPASDLESVGEGQYIEVGQKEAPAEDLLSLEGTRLSNLFCNGIISAVNVGVMHRDTISHGMLRR